MKKTVNGKEVLPNCIYCGEPRIIEDVEDDMVYIKEIHAPDCEMLVRWKNVRGSKGTS